MFFVRPSLPRWPDSPIYLASPGLRKLYMQEMQLRPTVRIDCWRSLLNICVLLFFCFCFHVWSCFAPTLFVCFLIYISLSLFLFHDFPDFSWLPDSFSFLIVLTLFPFCCSIGFLASPFLLVWVLWMYWLVFFCWLCFAFACILTCCVLTWSLCFDHHVCLSWASSVFVFSVEIDTFTLVLSPFSVLFFWCFGTNFEQRLRFVLPCHSAPRLS